MDNTTLSLMFQEPLARVVTIELPDAFDADVIEHRVWLLYNLERKLSDGREAV